MKPEFTKCWTCPPALPGKRVTLLHRCPPTLGARVPLSPQCAAPHGATRPSISRASSSCWNSGAGGVDEALRDLSVCRACRRFPASCVRRAGRRGRLGECFPRRSKTPATFPAVAAHLRLRSPRFRPLVRTATSAACRDHRVHARRICPLSTRAGSQTVPADCESSPGHGALLLSLPHRARNSLRPGPLPALLHQTISARLRPATPCHRPGPPPQTRSAGHRAAYGRRSRKVLAKLPHLSRFGFRGLDAPRPPALL